ncbi:hypothetical protein [uncultured Brevundimonas sp.]|uniref:hypothetical protein n=1 Tax=uncultured Brevundimonas sp. TaxID=213418 RepID=UPI0030EF27AF|tara:strand:+ start:13546 stop:14388 length:843 start_codon:yes stop_codon:yes gene_type:complete
MAADGSYRVTGGAPLPDPARVAAAAATLDTDPPEAFAEPARAAALDRLERALGAVRTGDLTEAAAQLTHARSVLQDLTPAALETRKGLGGLFDSRGRRLKNFRGRFAAATAGLADVAKDMAERIEGVTRRNGALDNAWDGLREAVGDLDTHLSAVFGRLTPAAPAGEPSPLQQRGTALAAGREAALRTLPLIRRVQNTDARLVESLALCRQGIDSWRDDWKDGLGLAGRRPKRVRPDQTRLARTRDALLARIDSALTELDTARSRRVEIAARIEALRRPL